MRNDTLKQLSRTTSHLLALAACGLTVAIGLALRDVLVQADIVK